MDKRVSYDLNILSLGAGVQSSALLLMADAGAFGDPPNCAIFADTQAEPKAVYAHLTKLVAAVSIPVHIVTAGDLGANVLGAIGSGRYRSGQPPLYVRQSKETSQDEGLTTDTGGQLWRQCTSEYKIIPIQRKVRELLGFKPRQKINKKVRQWFGITTDEAHRMRDSRVPWIDNYYPLVDAKLSRRDCERWLTKRGWTPTKSACVWCPYTNNKRWLQMRREQPEEWKKAVAFDAALRDGGGKLHGVTGDAYVHRRTMPLPEAVAIDQPEEQQEFDFGNECEGMCGV